MPLDLQALLEPSRAAFLMMECQEGIIGGGGFGALAETVARHHTVAHIARLLHAARRARVPVFHCTMSRRP
ncbi:MAG: isochorismatase family protein, partial [Deltaproteobacteria bacterium]